MGWEGMGVYLNRLKTRIERATDASMNWIRKPKESVRLQSSDCEVELPLLCAIPFVTWDGHSSKVTSNWRPKYANM